MEEYILISLVPAKYKIISMTGDVHTRVCANTNTYLYA